MIPSIKFDSQFMLQTVQLLRNSSNTAKEIEEYLVIDHDPLSRMWNKESIVDKYKHLAYWIKELTELTDEKSISYKIVKRLQEITCAENSVIFSIYKKEKLKLLAGIVLAEGQLDYISKTVQAYLHRGDMELYSDTIVQSRRSPHEKQLHSFLCIPLKVARVTIAVCYLDGGPGFNIIRSEKLDILQEYCMVGALALKLASLKNKIVFQNEKRSKPCYGKKRMEEVFEYVNKNFLNEISKSDIANEFNIHPDYLSRQFKLFSGKTLKKYIRDIRTLKAAKRICTTNEKIIDIALACGFNSLRTFNRDFLHLMGISPTEYRQKETRRFT